MKVKGIKAIAEFFEVDPRTVRNWRNAGAPITKKYEADLGAVQLWKKKQSTGTSDSRQRDFYSAPTAEDKEFHELRKIKADADKKERENQEAMGKLMPTASVTERINVLNLELWRGLETFARALPPRLIHCTTEREMEAIIMVATKALGEAWSQRAAEAGPEGGAKS